MLNNIDRDPETAVWKTVPPDDIWVLDKLILGRKLGYACGPVGLDVPAPGYYIVRPCVNMLGLGLGAEKQWLENNTEHLPLGYFWCEFFEGQHLTVDYCAGEPVLTVEGYKDETTFTRWDRWVKISNSHAPEFPAVLKALADRYETINCEFIGGRLVEAHLRRNADFDNGIAEFVPVWTGDSTDPPPGYRYIDYPDVHGRIGAFVK